MRVVAAGILASLVGGGPAAAPAGSGGPPRGTAGEPPGRQAAGSPPEQPGSARPAVPARLHGVIDPGEGGLALVVFSGRGARVLRVSGSAFGWTLREIDGTRVVLVSESGEEVGLALAAEGGRDPGEASAGPDGVVRASPVRSSPDRSSGGSGGGSSHGSRGDSPGDQVAPPFEIRLSREEVTRRLAAELPRLLRETVVAPRVVGDAAVGLELLALPPGALLDDVGLRAGDVLLGVDDEPAPDSIAAVLQRLQNQAAVVLEVERAGGRIRLLCRIE